MRVLLVRPVWEASVLFKGSVVVELLSGAWRVSPPPLHLPASDLEAAVPRLLQAGAAGLAWRRLHRSDAAPAAIVRPLRRAYQYQALQAAVQEQHLAEVVGLVNAAGIEALVVKGWSAARLYADP